MIISVILPALVVASPTPTPRNLHVHLNVPRAATEDSVEGMESDFGPSKVERIAMMESEKESKTKAGPETTTNKVTQSTKNAKNNKSTKRKNKKREQIKPYHELNSTYNLTNLTLPHSA